MAFLLEACSADATGRMDGVGTRGYRWSAQRSRRALRSLADSVAVALARAGRWWRRRHKLGGAVRRLTRALLGTTTTAARPDGRGKSGGARSAALNAAALVLVLCSQMNYRFGTRLCRVRASRGRAGAQQHAPPVPLQTFTPAAFLGSRPEGVGVAGEMALRKHCARAPWEGEAVPWHDPRVVWNVTAGGGYDAHAGDDRRRSRGVRGALVTLVRGRIRGKDYTELREWLVAAESKMPWVYK